MNHMKEVAQLLGLEIGEEFRIEGHSSNNIYRLTEENIEYLSCGHWFSISSTLNKLLNDQYKVAKMPILDDIERKYLANVIKPFRNRIKHFYKYPCASGDSEAITAIMKDFDFLDFPSFKKGSMYKGMKLMEKYTIEDLGL